MRAAAVIALLLALSGAAFGGGDGFKVGIEEFVRAGADGATFRVVVKDGASIPTASDDGTRHLCRELQVRVQFRPEARFDRWTVLQDKNVGRKQHLEALAVLETAAASRAAVAFGYIGHGLHVPDKDKPCQVESRWLEVSPENPIPETSVCVLSYYRRP